MIFHSLLAASLLASAAIRAGEPAPVEVMILGTSTWPTPAVYGQFLQGSLEPSRSEVVQLGFRVGQLSHAQVVGIAADGDFPCEAVQNWARAHGRAEELDAMGAAIERKVQQESEMLAKQGIRQCVSEMPGWKLVEPNQFLPH